MDLASVEIAIENISKNPVVLPWSPVNVFFSGRPRPGYRHVVFDFIMVRDGAPDWRLARLHLSATEGPRDHQQLKTLLAGERVVIRAQVPIMPGAEKASEDPIVHPGSGRLKLGVRFDAPEDPLATSFGARYAENDVSFEVLPTLPAVPAIPASGKPPAVFRVQPTVASQGTTIRIDGYRLGVERFQDGNNQPLARYFFANGTVRVPVRRGGTANMSAGDPNTVTQFVTIAVPDDLPPGTWNVIVELDGVEGVAPSPVSVVEWQPPHAERIAPERVNPGSVVTITGTNFRERDTPALLDPQHKFELAQPVNWTATTHAFVVPIDAAEGEHTVHLDAFRPGERVGRQSEALTFTVQHAPLIPTIRDQTARAVGANQWIVLEGVRPFAWSERTEVEFSQGEHHVVTETETPKANRVRFPATLSPGAVSVRARIWHGGVASDWSEPATYNVAFAPVPVEISALFVGKTRQRVILAGPSPSVRFEAVSGDTISLTGSWPIDFSAEIPVTVEHRGESVGVSTKWTNQTTVQFAVPTHLRGGPWAIKIGAVDGTPPLTLPAVMYIHQP